MQNELFTFASYLADEAALISRKYFRNLSDIATKENLTPVTIADREIELRLREIIKANYPDHAVIGEEFANQSGNNRYSWVLDPIDGTVAFSSGKPTFTTLIALLEDNEPIFSIIDQSIINERFCGLIGDSAFLNGKKLTTSKIVNLTDCRLNATTPYMFKTEFERKFFEKVKQSVRMTSFGGDAYAFALLASGYIDVIVEADLQYYDVAALIPVITAAGGVITDWSGNAITQDFNGQCLACANIELHQQIINLG